MTICYVVFVICIVYDDVPAGKKKQYYVCRELEYRRDHMQIEQPIQHSQVQDWNAIECKRLYINPLQY